MKTIISKYFVWYGKCIRVMVASSNINYKKMTRPFMVFSDPYYSKLC